MSMIRLYARVLGLLGAEKRLAAGLIAANVALAVAAFAEPLIMGRIIDGLTHLSKDAPATALAPWIIAWVVFGLFTIGAGVAIALHSDRLAHRNRLSTMANFFEHVLELPIAFHSSNHSGRVLKAMLEGTNAMAWVWLNFFREHFSALLSVGVLLPLTLFVNWRLGAILVVLVLAFTALASYVLRRTETLQGEVEEFQSGLAAHASDALGNVAVIQSFTRARAEKEAMRTIIQDLLRVQIPVLSWWALANVATRASGTLTMTAIFITGIALHQKGAATVGEIVAFMSLATMLVTKLDHVVTFVNGVFMQAPKMREFFEVFDTVPTVRDRPHAKQVARFEGEVTFDEVAFSYDGRRSALDGVSFAARPGETVALVGTTGSGKSTTLGLLHRTFDPDAGAIRIDGIDIRDIGLSSLRHNIGVVFQEPMLFNRSIRENLQVGRPDATDAEMLDALDRAQASEFMARQPDGLDTIIGERGRSLSGGERQRLSIARALLKNPPMLILDEATSALDAATERKLQQALETVMEGRTTFVIAHRLATIRNADRILVFENGKIVEAGNFDELVALNQRFATLARAQFMAAEAEDDMPLAA
ncbi:glucan ABC transporter ATP-binding protein/ permease [Methylorubrum extorquens]|jgi:ATP-binding cassette, subfamily B, beta-glucan exporter|uniref:Beta-1,2-glucan ABC transporter, ATPase and permease domains n=1 Tax=Methylorubrum extorquens (strain ATCC 14718 / DSM 1338 / JCM 2805 / NCIMB 9133 / AM1) TaxID=272630 RepID=C5AVA2_METEA|nr:MULTISPECIES: glucan ABC transporter ATP-binding protein/ permease [Methylorubrum]ACS42888.1 putative beta-1,2-glucan ABC transporter, ATPase and permease domains [Methylorubrum extorquens AM1]MCP1544045.1 ATP-binding cassette subfamily B protein [Methylorubrum extorquens]MCP1588609.1 ATP-binding cassette subfamily B protein [Methylorubrum extorquens]BDL42364.1 beta-(1-->2)glucan export ATP-binding/permease protein NdvA [Methylorubrum sp. GM97]